MTNDHELPKKLRDHNRRKKPIGGRVLKYFNHG